MSRSRYIRIPVAMAQSQHTSPDQKRAEMSIRWRGVCWFEFLLSSCFVSSGIALIESDSPVSRSPPTSKDHHPLLFLLLHRFAFLFLFWLGSATDHNAHTPTTTRFQYLSSIDRGSSSQQALYRRSALAVSRRTDVARDSYIMPSQMLNLWHATRGVPPPVHGWEGILHGWGPYPWIVSTCRVRHNEDSPSVYLISLSGLIPLFNTIGAYHPWVFLHETDNRIQQ